MKDFFGTVIEPGDTVVVAWGKPGKGSTAGKLELCTAKPKIKAEGVVLHRDSDGRRCSFGIGPHNVISMKSIGFWSRSWTTNGVDDSMAGTGR